MGRFSQKLSFASGSINLCLPDGESMVEDSGELILKALREVIETVSVAEVLATPFNESIVNLLERSSESIGAEGASVLLPSASDGELEFTWACGSVSANLIGVRVPPGKGIAGFVFATGQPMAVSDTGSESSFYPEIDKNTGFSTSSILATPLQYDGDITGVLEYVNRRHDDPSRPFTPEEMDLAAHYADAVASMVHAYRSADLLGAFSDNVLSGVSDRGGAAPDAIIKEFSGPAAGDGLLELADLVRRVAVLGERDRSLCVGILKAVLAAAEENTGAPPAGSS